MRPGGTEERFDALKGKVPETVGFWRQPRCRLPHSGQQAPDDAGYPHCSQHPCRRRQRRETARRRSGTSRSGRSGHQGKPIMPSVLRTYQSGSNTGQPKGRRSTAQPGLSCQPNSAGERPHDMPMCPPPAPNAQCTPSCHPMYAQSETMNQASPRRNAARRSLVGVSRIATRSHSLPPSRSGPARSRSRLRRSPVPPPCPLCLCGENYWRLSLVSCAYALWLWMDSKFSLLIEYQLMRSSASSSRARSRTMSSTNLGFS